MAEQRLGASKAFHQTSQSTRRYEKTMKAILFILFSLLPLGAASTEWQEFDTPAGYVDTLFEGNNFNLQVACGLDSLQLKKHKKWSPKFSIRLYSEDGETYVENAISSTGEPNSLLMATSRNKAKPGEVEEELYFTSKDTTSVMALIIVQQEESLELALSVKSTYTGRTKISKYSFTKIGSYKVYASGASGRYQCISL